MTSLSYDFSTCAGENHSTSVLAAAYVKRERTAVSLELHCSDLSMNFGLLFLSLL